MKRFYFDLIGDVPARDFLGHEFASRKKAKAHASFIAHRLGNQHPHFAKRGNRISVRDEDGTNFYDTPVSLTRH
jgi:hypothetical protein